MKPRQCPSPLRQIPTTTDIFYDGIRGVARRAFRIDPTSTLRVMRVPRLRNGTVERGMRQRTNDRFAFAVVVICNDYREYNVRSTKYQYTNIYIYIYTSTGTTREPVNLWGFQSKNEHRNDVPAEV